MKKLISGLVLSAVLLIPALGLAQTPEPVMPSQLDLPTIFTNIVDWALGLLLSFAALMLIIAGYLFVTAQGDPDKVAKARMFVLWALVGVLVGVISWALVLFVETQIAR